jgi:hypothetical protein
MSRTWANIKTTFETRKEALDNYKNTQLTNDINTLKASLTNYVKKGGVSQNPANDADYNKMIELYQKIKTKKDEYKTLNSDLSSKIREVSTAGDMGAILAENGTLQSEITDLQVKLKESNDDVKSAELRDEFLRTQDSNITKHQVFMLGRPLRPNSIPYLWALSVLFIGAAILVFQTQGPSLLEPISAWFFTASATGSFLMDSRIWILLSGAFAIVILFLSLRVANVI